MLKTKEELLALGYTDEGSYGVSKEIPVPEGYRSYYKIMIDSTRLDVYVVNFGRMGSDKVMEVKDALVTLDKDREVGQTARKYLSEAGYDGEM